MVARNLQPRVSLVHKPINLHRQVFSVADQRIRVPLGVLERSAKAISRIPHNQAPEFLEILHLVSNNLNNRQALSEPSDSKTSSSSSSNNHNNHNKVVVFLAARLLVAPRISQLLAPLVHLEMVRIHYTGWLWSINPWHRSRQHLERVRQYRHQCFRSACSASTTANDQHLRQHPTR